MTPAKRRELARMRASLAWITAFLDCLDEQRPVSILPLREPEEFRPC